MTAPLPDLLLYGRPGCHLCVETRRSLAAVLAEREAAGLPTPLVREVDISGDPELVRAFGSTIPVVELGHRRLELITSAGRLRRLLADVLDTGPAATDEQPPADAVAGSR